MNKLTTISATISENGTWSLRLTIKPSGYGRVAIVSGVSIKFVFKRWCEKK